MFVGLPENKQSFRVFSLTGGRRNLSGSNIGGIRETQEMLDFCAEHGHRRRSSRRSPPTTSTRPTTASSHSDVRYRFVIDTSTIPAG